DNAAKLVEKDRKLVRFFLPPASRWANVSKQTTGVGEYLTDAVRAVAKANPALAGVIDVTDFNATAAGDAGADRRHRPAGRGEGLQPAAGRPPVGAAGRPARALSAGHRLARRGGRHRVRGPPEDDAGRPGRHAEDHRGTAQGENGARGLGLV